MSSQKQDGFTGYFSQDVGEMSGGTVLEEVMSGAGEVVQLGRRMREMEVQMAEPMEDNALAELLEQDETITEIFEHRGGYDLDARAKAILSGLGFAESDIALPVKTFSGGWKILHRKITRGFGNKYDGHNCAQVWVRFGCSD